MTTRLLRVTLVCLALSAAVIAVQGTLAPRSFYDGFPFGRGWVESLPPYNEHLVRDVAGFYLAFTILFAWAAVTTPPPSEVNTTSGCRSSMSAAMSPSPTARPNASTTSRCCSGVAG